MTTILFWPEKFHRQYRRSPRLSFGAAPVHLVFEFACVTARGADTISLSVSPAEVHASLGHPIDITVKVTNTSSTARYVGRAIVAYLEYDVKDATGHILVPFSDPPAPPPTPCTGEDFIWLDPGQFFVFHQRIPLKSWGIKSAGRYTVVAFSNGTVATDAEWQHKKYGFFFAYAPQISVIVAGAK